MAVDDKNVLEIVARLEAEVATFMAEINRAKKGVDAFSASGAAGTKIWSQHFTSLGNGLQSAGRKIEGFGLGILKYAGILGGALTGAVLAVIKLQSDFETAFSDVQKTVDATDEEFQQYRRDLVEMSKEVPIAVEELARLMSVAGQLGVSGRDNLLAFTKTAALLGETTDMSSEEAVNGLAGLITILQMSLKDVDRLGAALNTLGANSNAGEKDILAMALRIAGAGHSAGMSANQILALATTTAGMRVEAEMGGSALSKLITEFSLMTASGKKSEESLQKFAKVAGVTAEQFRALIKANPYDALQLFFQGLDKARQGGQDLNIVLNQLGFDEVRMMDTVKRLASGHGDMAKNVELANRAFKENQSLTTEAARRFNTFAGQMTLLWNNIKAIFISPDGFNILTPLTTAIKERALPAVRELQKRIEANGAAIQAWIDGKISLAIAKLDEWSKYIWANREAIGRWIIDFATWVETWGPTILKIGLWSIAVGWLARYLGMAALALKGLMGITGIGSWLGGILGTAGAAGTGAGAAGFLGLVSVLALLVGAGGLLTHFSDTVFELVNDRFPRLAIALDTIGGTLADIYGWLVKIMGVFPGGGIGMDFLKWMMSNPNAGGPTLGPRVKGGAAMPAPSGASALRMPAMAGGIGARGGSVINVTMPLHVDNIANLSDAMIENAMNRVAKIARRRVGV